MAIVLGFPSVASKLVDPETGLIQQSWYQLILTLWQRTGSGTGTDADSSAALALAMGDSEDQLHGPAAFSELIIGDPGYEGDGITVNGVLYTSTFKSSDINGTNYAQNIMHRHSTTLEPLLAGARSYSNVMTHADVINGLNLFSIYGLGFAGNDYKIFGTLSVGVDATGTVSNTSAPGRWTLSVTPDGSLTPVTAVTIKNSGIATFAFGIAGTGTNDAATTGNIGEFVSSVIAVGSAVALTTATPANVTSISLTAGDWDVWGALGITGNVATTLASVQGSLSLTSATLLTVPGAYSADVPVAAALATLTQLHYPIAGTRLSIAATTTVYLVAQVAFAVNTCSAFGIIQARRVR